MEIELNTSNLRNLCRICLGAGDYNLWEHKVCLTNECNLVDEGNLQDAEEITVHEVLQMYNDWQDTILDLDSDLQVICKDCLSELESHYRYYKRLLAANKHIKQLYEEALHKEDNKPFLTDQVIIEHVGFEKNIPEFIDDASAISQPDHTVIHPSPPKQAQKRKFVRNPKFILTGGVTQLLTHAKGATSFATSMEAVDSLQEPGNLCSPQKRKRKEFEEQTSEAQVVKISSEFREEGKTNSTNKPVSSDDIISSPNKQEHHHAVSTTVEELVEVLHTNEIIFETVSNDSVDEMVANKYEKETPIEIEKYERAALPFSTLSVDKAGRSIYVCKYCPQAFTAPCFLLNHARKSHICKHCSKGFSKTTDLFAHVKNAHQEHKCGICGKELSTHGNLRAHIKRIHRLKMCDLKSHLVPEDGVNERIGIIEEDSGDGVGESFYIEESSQPLTAEFLD